MKSLTRGKILAGVLLVGFLGGAFFVYNQGRVGKVLDSYRGVPVYDNGLLFFRSAEHLWSYPAAPLAPLQQRSVFCDSAPSACGLVACPAVRRILGSRAHLAPPHRALSLRMQVAYS